ncbi:3-galactosyl-N-acetylglucosaminide 4-alpha-L-fucosyltransferase FUT3-like [Haliotis asinina]|uniref:3-galactosyl-N-acetylglucosaminide 4-alpha-L-fucosyltransferase FUT3-like n=1 Tax=Haliotis asinina TaxID=109174 RepID=UPI0035325F29
MLRVLAMANARRCNYWMYGLRIVKTTLLVLAASLTLLFVSRYLFHSKLPASTPVSVFNLKVKDRRYVPKPTQSILQHHNTPHFLKLWAEEKKQNDTKVERKENLRIQHGLPKLLRNDDPKPLQYAENKHRDSVPIQYVENKQRVSNPVKYVKNKQSASNPVKYAKNKQSAPNPVKYVENKQSASNPVKYVENKQSVPKPLQYVGNKQSVPKPLQYVENKYGASKSSQNVEKREPRLIVWHMIPSYRKHKPSKIISCGKYQCVTSSNKSRLADADAVIVDAFLLSRNKVKEKPVRTSHNQVWIFFAKEPWANYASQFPGGDWDTIFNWTLTYQRNSDFVASYGDLTLKKPKDVVTYNWTDVMKKKTRSVLWFVSNCHSGSRREKYVEELQKYIDVDIVGRCGKPKCMEDNGEDQLSRCYGQHWFYLSFESLFCQDYVTEKLFKTFSYNILPIVRGKANYAQIYPKDLFLNTADFRSPHDLVKHLKYLKNNRDIYVEYLKRRAQYRVWGRGLGECNICSRLHQVDRYRKSYASITNWFDTCETPQKPNLH